MKIGLFIAFILIVSTIGYFFWDKYIQTFKVIKYDDGTKIVVSKNGGPVTFKGIELPQLDLEIINKVKRELEEERLINIPKITIEDL